MIVADDLFVRAEDLLVEVGCFPMPAEVIEREREVVAAVQAVGMVGAEDAFVADERLSVEVGRFLVVAEVAEREA